MQVTNRNAYSNEILIAIVVNSDTDQDPQSNYRVQIYIPSLQYQYDSIYESYMNSSDKTSNEHFSKFPWAKTLVEDLTEGNIVYCSNINNSSSDYIIIGLDATNPVNATSDESVYTVSGSSLLDLTMPIILHNEIGIAVSDWPDNIDTSKYATVLGNDNGAFSVGLIQWNAARAYDVLLKIANNDSEWKSAWTSTNYTLYTHLKTLSSSYRSNYNSFTVAEGSELYTCIQNMLSGTDTAKEVQREYASEDTESNLNKIEEAGVTNVMIKIFLADLMNQYGSNLTNTIAKAASISSGSGDTESQFDDFVTYCQNNIATYYTYKNRRTTTISYVKQLYEEGKLTSTDLGEASSYGFIFPVPGLNKETAINNKNWPSYSGHTGVDINRGVTEGTTQIVAVAAGKVIYSQDARKATSYTGYGECIIIDHQNGLCTLYAHMYDNSRTVAVGETVTQGQKIGILGNTGNSTGPHLHFEVRTGSNQLTQANCQNPLPYLP